MFTIELFNYDFIVVSYTADARYHMAIGRGDGVSSSVIGIKEAF